MHICLFEDQQLNRFHPLTLTRPVDDLRVGILTVGEKWERALQADRVTRLLRRNLYGLFPGDPIDLSQSCLWINSRYLPEEALVNRIKELEVGSCLQHNSTVIAAHVGGEDSKQWMEAGNTSFNSLFVVESNPFTCLQQLWDLFQMNGREIRNDLERLDPVAVGSQANAHISDHAVLERSSDIYIEDSASIEAGVILDARKGPIFIGKGATVMAGSVIKGPVAICADATVKAGAKIYEDTTIGPVCKVGGEVINCIFHSYSNKAHDGFVGNSLFGQWCNLGADTNTSNLKNNYSPVRITDWDTGKEIETGQQFLGTVMGDHSKTAINTQLNTGTICGVSCNIFSGDFPPKFIPSFSWVGSNVIQPYKIDKALEAMEAMMARRSVKLEEPYRQLMVSLFKKQHK